MDEKDTKLPEKAPLGEFPFNQVRVWPDGRELHVNYTPGNFTTRFWTHTGTGFEIDKDGRFVMSASNNSHTYSKGGSVTTTDKNVESKIGGGSRVTNDGGSHTENGQSTTSVTNGATSNISKTTNLNASAGDKGEELVSGDKVTKVSGSIHLLVSGDNVMYIKGNKVESVSGESSEEVAGNKNDNVTGQYQIIIGSKLIIKVPEIQFDFTNMTMNGTSLTMNINDVHTYGTSLRHNGANIGDSHTHGGIVPGGADTDVPNA